MTQSDCEEVDEEEVEEVVEEQVEEQVEETVEVVVNADDGAGCVGTLLCGADLWRDQFTKSSRRTGQASLGS